MKKKKLIFVGAIASLSVCALASCGGTDYKSKDFTVETPTKDSKATIEYKTNEELKELDSKILSHHFGNGATAEDSTKKEELKKEFFKKYHSIMDYGNIYDETTKRGYDYKSIYCLSSDEKTRAVYYYENNYNMVDDKKETTLTLESNAVFYENDDYVVNTIITANNFLDDDENTVSGTAKITTKENGAPTDWIDRIFEASFITSVGEISNCDALSFCTNEDASYIYALIKRDQNQYVTEVNDYLITGHSYTKTNNLYSYITKYEYIENSILDTNINTDGYIEYNYFKLGRKTYSYPSYPFIFFPCESMSSWNDYIKELICYSYEARSWFNVTE